MERIYYCSGSSFLTGDTIAAALTEHARLVTALHRSELVDVPQRRPDGSLGRIRLLLSPTTQLAAEALPATDAELVDELFVADLEARTALLRTPPSPVTEQLWNPELAYDY